MVNRSPEFNHSGGIYMLKWPELQLGMKVDRISEDSKHVVHGEITVTTSAPGMNPHLHQARLNLTSTRSRREVARHLARIINAEEATMDGIMEQACVMVVGAFRQGEPVIKLANRPETERLKFKLEPFLLEGQANLIFGDGASTKSLLAAYLAVLVDTGEMSNGYISEPGRVLYLDYEASADELDERIKAINAGMGIEAPSDIYYRFCYQSIAADAEAIQEFVLENDITFLIIDSAGPACGGNPNEAQIGISYFNALRSLRVTSLTIAHQPKNLSEINKPFGSQFWWNMSRSVFQVKKTQELGEDVVQTGLFHRKANTSRLEKPIGFRIEFQNNQRHLASVTFDKIEVRDVPELAQGQSLKDQLVDILRAGLTEVPELSEITGKAENSVRAQLSRHKTTFVKVGERWGLVTHHY